MLLYNINNNEIGSRLVANSTELIHPCPSYGVYEYQKVECDPKTKTIGKVKVENDIAKKMIIDFPKWVYIQEPIRIILDDSLIVEGGDYDAMYRKLRIKKTLFEPYSYTETGVYLSYLIASDGFSVDEKGVIKHTDPRLKVEQSEFNFIEKDGIIRQSD